MAPVFSLSCVECEIFVFVIIYNRSRKRKRIKISYRNLVNLLVRFSRDLSRFL
ncbi:hypothetical protein Hanom_Chr01g00045231 [Helianthus anomalus]